jgi:hypothetical protein
MAGPQSCPLVMRLDSGVEIFREVELPSVTVESEICSVDQPPTALMSQIVNRMCLQRSIDLASPSDCIRMIIPDERIPDLSPLPEIGVRS